MFLNKIHELAYEQMTQGNHLKALELYNQCILEFPNAAVLFSERGVNYIHLNEEEKSMTDFNHSIFLDPNYAYRYASRGHARDHFGDLDGAIMDYEKAVELDPKDDIAYNNLGLLLEKKGNQTKAQMYFERSNKLREAENRLMETIDKIEENSNNSNDYLQEDEGPVVSETKVPSTILQVLIHLFKSAEYRKEYVSFLKNSLTRKSK